METLTITEVAERIGLKTPQEMERIKYAVRAYGILPVRRAGIVRLFSENDVPRIVSAYKRVLERTK